MTGVTQESRGEEERRRGEIRDWKAGVRSGGSLREIVDLDTGTNGWAAPPGSAFQVRGHNYFAKRVKAAAGECVMKPLGVDWLRSHGKLDHVLARPDNRVRRALDLAQAQREGLKSFVFAVNLQVPGKENYSAVFYYATDDPIAPGSLLYRFIHEDDGFRNSRFKLINRIVRGPWIVKATVGNHAACLLGKALTCHYIRGPNYLEIDVDIGSSTVATYILHLALGYVSSVVVDMGFLVESQAEEELPERLLGTVRIAQIEMESAVFVDHEQDHHQQQGLSCSNSNHPGTNASAANSWQRRLGFSFRGHHSTKNGKVAERDHCKA
ncbi:protein ENHANCED DISEASE RESISTANCE 2-like [Selaginella moellendorffii]|nr:protein ENHANCED DISEASE RESISTANCE 2-like [Selaginella moellendorffii]|eukprot:XP_002985462.2 protein ENHANCED DISEASE RESISTANCE 2-like [Selaginella moellendorffii]